MIVLSQSAPAVPNSIGEMVLSSDLVTKVVLGILAVLSLISWTIMIAKWWEFRALERASTQFVGDVERATKFEQAAAFARRAKPSAFTRVVMRAAEFVADVRAAGANGHEGAQLSAAQVEALRLVLDAEAESSRDQYGGYIPVLAMIASASPLIGLLGTVLGVMSAFLGIASKGGSIASVGPGVATALVATAAALTVAIPAVFGYNIFANRLNRVAARVDGFGSEVIGLMAREGRL